MITAIIMVMMITAIIMVMMMMVMMMMTGDLPWGSMCWQSTESQRDASQPGHTSYVIIIITVAIVIIIIIAERDIAGYSVAATLRAEREREGLSASCSQLSV